MPFPTPGGLSAAFSNRYPSRSLPMRLLVPLFFSLLVGSPLLAQQSQVLMMDTLVLRQQNPLSLRLGSRIRLNAPAADDPWVDGHVVDYDGSSFAFTIDGRPRVVYLKDYREVNVIDVRRRLVRNSAQDGALWGLYLGTTLGMIAAPFAAKELPIGMGASVAALGSGGALLGAFTGAATGALLAPGRWYRHVFTRGG